MLLRGKHEAATCIHAATVVYGSVGFAFYKSTGVDGPGRGRTESLQENHITS